MVFRHFPMVFTLTFFASMDQPKSMECGLKPWFVAVAEQALGGFVASSPEKCMGNDGWHVLRVSNRRNWNIPDGGLLVA
jgi:hypothetical protein